MGLLSEHEDYRERRTIYPTTDFSEKRKRKRAYKQKKIFTIQRKQSLGFRNETRMHVSQPRRAHNPPSPSRNPHTHPNPPEPGAPDQTPAVSGIRDPRRRAGKRLDPTACAVHRSLLPTPCRPARPESVVFAGEAFVYFGPRS